MRIWYYKIIMASNEDSRRTKRYAAMTKKELLAVLEKKNRKLTELKAYEHWHRKIQETLQKKEKLLRAVFESTPGAVQVWDPDHRYLYVNQAALAYLGKSQKQVVKENLEDVMKHIPEFRRIWMERIDQVFETGESIRVEDVMPVGNRLVYSEIAMSPVKDTDGTIFAIAAVSRDVTEQNKMQQKIAEALDLNVKILEASTLGIVAYRKSGQAVFTNEAAGHIIGATREQVLAQNFNNIESWNRSGLVAVAVEALSSGEERRHEIHVLTTFGHEVNLDCRLVPFTLEEEPHLLLLFDDVTEQRRVERLYGRMLNYSRTGVYQYTFRDGVVLFANQGLVDILDLDCPPNAIVGKPLKKLLVYVEQEASIRGLLEKNGELHDHEYHFRTLKGDDRWVVHDSFLFTDPLSGEKLVETVVKDITGRKLAERKLKHVDSVLRTINTINQLMVREENREQLLENACTNLTEVPGFYSAWAALLDEENNVTFTTSTGIPRRRFSSFVKHLKSGPSPHCVPLLGEKSELVTVIDDIESTCAGCPLLQKKTDRGHMVARLEHGERVFGFLGVALPSKFIRDPEERELFEEIASDIGFALYGLNIEHERRQAEEQIKEERDRAQMYLDTAGVMLVAIDTGGNVFLINRKGCEVLGYREKEIIGKNWFDNFLPERIRREIKTLSAKLLAGEVEPVDSFENPILTAEGEERLVAWNQTLLKDDLGNIVGHFSSGEDITERRRTEEQIHRQTGLLEGINTVLLEGLLCETEEEMAQKCLSVAESLTGSRFGFIGEINSGGTFDTVAISNPGWDACRMPKSDAVKAIRGMVIRGLWGSVLKTGRPMIINEPADHPDSVGIPGGHPLIISFLGVPLKNAGTTVGMFALANKEGGYEQQDIDAVNALVVAYEAALNQRRGAVALGESEEKLRTLYTSMKEGVGLHEVIYDEAGQPRDYRIIDVNPAYELIIGFHREDIVGRKASDIYGIGEAPYLEVYAQVAGSGNPVTFESYYPPMDKHFRISAFSPGTGKFATVFADITASKLAEESILRQRATVDGINTVLLETLTCDTDEEVAQRCLSVAEDLTGSEFGLIGEMDDFGNLDIIALSEPGWEKPAIQDNDLVISDSDSANPNSAAVRMVKVVRRLETTEIWTKVVGERKSMVVNTPASIPGFSSDKDLAAEIKSLMAVPLKYEDRTFGLIILANKMTGYVGNDKEAIESLTVSFVEALYRKRYETALLESEERFQFVARATNDAIWDRDLATDRMWWNEAVQVLFGYRAGEIGPRAYWWEQNIHPDDRDRVTSGLQWAVEHNKTVWFDEYRFLRREGSFAHVLDRGFILHSSAGRPIRMIGSMFDISELKRAEARLRESQERFQRLFEYSPISLWEEDFSAIKERFDQLRARGIYDLNRYIVDSPKFVRECVRLVKILDVNKATVKMYRAQRKEDLITNHSLVFGEELYRVFAHELVALFSGKTTFSSDAVTWTLKGEKKFVSMELNVVPGHEGDLDRVLISIIDITERTEAREALRNMVQELERSNQELEQFAYIASHDLQEPLRKVMMFGDRLMDRYDDVLDERGIHYIDRMTDAASRMKNLIMNLLRYSRVTTRAQPFEPVDLEKILREVVSDLEVIIKESGTIFETGELPVVTGDRIQLRQVLQNLIHNAIKFRQEGLTPYVTITARKLTASQQVAISVKDNGIGFDIKFTDRIFKPFQRLHHRFEYEGVGMGLAICDKIVARHGGTIEVSSTPGEGTEFTIMLPADQN